MFEKRHFEAVADRLANRLANPYRMAKEARKFDYTIKELNGYADGVLDTIADLMRLFANDNPRFDAERFADAIVKGLDEDMANSVKKELLE